MMTANKLNFENPDNRSESDLKKIMKVALKEGYQISPMQAYHIWNNHSDSYAAGWLLLDNEYEIRQAVNKYIDEV